MALLLQTCDAQKGGAKAGMRRGGKGGRGGGGRGGGARNSGDAGGMGDWSSRGYGDANRKRPCVGICYLR